MGERVNPGYVTSAFSKLLEKNGLRKIRFHDLRHSCASLLLANGVPMKQIQEWLGHSDFATTAIFMLILTSDQRFYLQKQCHKDYKLGK
jgi:integrase